MSTSKLPPNHGLHVVSRGNRAVIARAYSPRPNKGNISIRKIVTGTKLIKVRVT